MAAKAKGRFIDPMLLLRTNSLPNDSNRWQYQLKFDGYRAIAFKTGGTIHLRSRNNNDFSIRYSDVVKGLATLPDETVIDGEAIALDDDGRPSFNILQNYGSSKAPVLYFVFDVMVLAGRDVMREPLETRRELLEKKILPKLGEPVRYAAPLDASLPVLIESVKAQGLEGLVAKRLDSRYEAGLRSGAWLKMRVNRAQEFVVGGYTVGTKTFDALVFGYYEGDRLIYAARTRNGFTPVVRGQLSALLLETLNAVRDLRSFVPLVRELCHRQGEWLQISGDSQWSSVLKTTSCPACAKIVPSLPPINPEPSMPMRMSTAFVLR
jgi:bifunctional non-homologous end joining protein LigD